MIELAHLEDGDRVISTALLLRGLTDRNDTRVRVGRDDVPTDAGHGRFKALVPLALGPNTITIENADESLDVVVERIAPPLDAPAVRIVYMTDLSGNPQYQSPYQDDPQDAHDKLAASLIALQAFSAEAMLDAGYTRKTFPLVSDASGRPIVHELRGELQAHAYAKFEDSAWYEQVQREARDAFGADGDTYAVIASYTRWDAATQTVHNHTALGGDDLGLFGSGSLFSWPSHTERVLEAFHDETPVDGTQIFDDSNGRSTVWALASTTLGATLHELGHCYTLPHCDDPFCVMTRGFDYLNRAFTVEEPAHKGAARPYVFAPDEEARWCESCAATLDAHPAWR